MTNLKKVSKEINITNNKEENSIEIGVVVMVSLHVMIVRNTKIGRKRTTINVPNCENRLVSILLRFEVIVWF